MGHHMADQSIIVTVDDLALHPAVQRALEIGAERGFVTDALLLTNGPYIEGARSISGISLGAHLNLLRGRPLSLPTDIPTLVGADGNYLGNYGTLLAQFY